ncbi:hypothetical protein ACSU1N_07130 [Thermogladius sp. 4427co]|uniref:hypothetical protein n=1 Tax=Thermogladius sp. 4427co TaxID=3450718 RepID=UPI003F7A7972
MNRLVIIALLTLLVVIPFAITPLPVNSQKFVQSMKFIMIYAPSADPAVIMNSSLVGNNTEIIKVEPEPPYSYLLDLMRIIDPSINISVNIINETIAFAGNRYASLVELVNQSFVNTIWRGNFTVFIGVPGLNPNTTGMAINPYYNLSGNYIQPEVFDIPVNGSTYWSILNTSLQLLKTNEGFSINLTNYGVLQYFDNNTLDTPSFAVSVPSGLNISPGIYYLKFKIISVNTTHVRVLFPGTLVSSGWLNSFYGSFTEPVVIIKLIPIEFLKTLPPDALLWVFNLSCNLYNYLATKATWYTSGGVYIMYYPVFQDLERLKPLVNESLYRMLEDMALKNLGDIVSSFRLYLGVNSTIVIYNPFKPVSPRAGIGLPELNPGVYDATGDTDILKTLGDQGWSFTVRNIGGRVLVEVYDYSRLGFGEGFILLVKPAGVNETLATAHVVKQSVFEDLVRSYTSLYYPSPALLVETGFEMQDLIDNLTNRINVLNDQVKSLNETVNILLVNAGNCNATVANLTVKLLDYENRVSQAENMLNQARQYAIFGLVATVAIALSLYYIVLKGVKMK